MRHPLQQDEPMASRNMPRLQHKFPVDYQVITEQVRGSNRVAIIGNQGAGKTTLATQLGAIVGIDYVPITWSPDMSTRETSALEEQFQNRATWIIDGDFGLLRLADLVIHLDFSVTLCFSRDIRRRLENLRNWDFCQFDTYIRFIKRIFQTLAFWPRIYWSPSRASYPLEQLGHPGNFASLSTSTSFRRLCANESRTPKLFVLKSPKEVALLLAALEVL